METALQITGLTKSFGHRLILDHISLEVYAGEVFGFLGPNGAGKTTLIKTVMGFLSADEGSIVINGTDVKQNYEKAMAEIGGIVENPEMYKELSGLTNLEMYARLHDGVTRERIFEVAALVGMQNRIHEKVKSYSLGMKQRIGLAQALLHRPKLLILDEPTNGLDPAGIREFRDILKKLAHEEQIAVMVSSHMLSEMELMCDRVGIIVGGKLVGVEPIEALLHRVKGQNVYRISAKPLEKAAQVITDMYPDAQPRCTDTVVELPLETEQVPQTVAALVQSGIDVYGIQQADVSLEDAFLNITGGGNLIA